MTTPDIPLVFRKKRLTHETLNRLANAGFFYCPRCQQVKVLSDFRVNAARKNGVRTPCKACEKKSDQTRGPTAQRRSVGYMHNYMRDYNRKRRSIPEVRAAIIAQNKRWRAKYGRTKTPDRHAVIHGLYILQMGEVFKIGKSTNIYRRIAELSALLPFTCELIHYIPVEGDLTLAEWTMHQRFAHHRLNGEWFALTPDDIAEIKNVGGASEG